MMKLKIKCPICGFKTTITNFDILGCTIDDAEKLGTTFNCPFCDEKIYFNKDNCTMLVPQTQNSSCLQKI